MELILNSNHCSSQAWLLVMRWSMNQERSILHNVMVTNITGTCWIDSLLSLLLSLQCHRVEARQTYWYLVKLTLLTLVTTTLLFIFSLVFVIVSMETFQSTMILWGPKHCSNLHANLSILFGWAGHSYTCVIRTELMTTLVLSAYRHWKLHKKTGVQS